MDERGGIGFHNNLPWHLRSDLQRFRQITMGHHLVMGRKTWESIGRVLPGRVMVVLSRQASLTLPGCVVQHSMDQVLAHIRLTGETIAFIIGGGEIFVQALPVVDRIYLTRVHTIVQADTFFPPIYFSDWRLTEFQCHEPDEQDDFASTFMLLDPIRA
jgi:dihydrofolate reductase